MQKIMKPSKWKAPCIAILIIGLATFTGQQPIAKGRAFVPIAGIHFISYTTYNSQLGTNIQHIIFVDKNHHINELYYGPSLHGGQWWHTDLTQAVQTAEGGAPPITAGDNTSLVGYTDQYATENKENSDLMQHVDFIGAGGDLHEFWSVGEPVLWHDTDLTQKVHLSGANAPKAASPLFGYMLDGVGHVIYISNSGDIYEFAYVLSPSLTSTIRDLTTDLKVPAPGQGSHLAGYVWSNDNSQHILYIGPKGDIQELWYKIKNNNGQDTGLWHDTDLMMSQPQLTRPKSNSPLTGYTEGTNEYMVYIDTNNHIHEITYDSAPGGKWANTDVTKAVSPLPPLPSANSSLASYSDGQNHQYIIYIGTKGHIQELLSSSSGSWSIIDLTQKVAGSTLPVGGSDLVDYSWKADNLQHVIYIGSDQSIYEFLSSDQQTWHGFNITAAWP